MAARAPDARLRAARDDAVEQADREGEEARRPRAALHDRFRAADDPARLSGRDRARSFASISARFARRGTARRARAPISEIEIELEKGSASNLFGLAQRLAEDLPVAVLTRSKAERGYALLQGERDVIGTPVARGRRSARRGRDDRRGARGARARMPAADRRQCAGPARRQRCRMGPPDADRHAAAALVPAPRREVRAFRRVEGPRCRRASGSRAFSGRRAIGTSSSARRCRRLPRGSRAIARPHPG